MSDYYVDKNSVVDPGCQIGQGTKIWHYSHILKGSVIGKNCVFGQNCSVGPSVKIGNNCKVQNNVSIYKGVTLQDAVFCGPSCVFTNVYTPRAFVERKDEFLETIVKKGASIGANATIICGNDIGKYAFVGAGAVVKSNVPDYAVVVGVPARQIGWACQCGNILKLDNNHTTCKRCGNEYELKQKNLIPIKETLDV